jgi:hypothetical protein
MPIISSLLALLLLGSLDTILGEYLRQFADIAAVVLLLLDNVSFFFYGLLVDIHLLAIGIHIGAAVLCLSHFKDLFF